MGVSSLPEKMSEVPSTRQIRILRFYCWIHRGEGEKRKHCGNQVMMSLMSVPRPHS